MTSAILCATVTILTMLALPTIASRYGSDVGGRFLERTGKYDAGTLRGWVDAHPREARAYAFPVLFPLDVLFMAALTAFVSFGSISEAHMAGLGTGRSWVFLLLPVAYVTADLVEDSLLAAMLTHPDWIGDGVVLLTTRITQLKLATATLSLFQVLALSVLAAPRVHQ